MATRQNLKPDRGLSAAICYLANRSLLDSTDARDGDVSPGSDAGDKQLAFSTVCPRESEGQTPGRCERTTRRSEWRRLVTMTLKPWLSL